MAQYFLTKEALRDLSKIWDYTLETWSEEQADKYYFDLLSACHELAVNPLMGKSYEVLGKGILGFRKVIT